MHDPSDKEAALAALRRWGFPEEGDPDFAQRAVTALQKIDEAHGVLYPEQHELLANLNYDSDPVRVAALYFGCAMQAAFYAAADAKSGGDA